MGSWADNAGPTFINYVLNCSRILCLSQCRSKGNINGGGTQVREM